MCVFQVSLSFAIITVSEFGSRNSSVFISLGVFRELNYIVPQGTCVQRKFSSSQSKVGISSTNPENCSKKLCDTKHEIEVRSERLLHNNYNLGLFAREHEFHRWMYIVKTIGKIRLSSMPFDVCFTLLLANNQKCQPVLKCRQETVTFRVLCHITHSSKCDNVKLTVKHVWHCTVCVWIPRLQNTHTHTNTKRHSRVECAPFV